MGPVHRAKFKTIYLISFTYILYTAIPLIDNILDKNLFKSDCYAI